MIDIRGPSTHGESILGFILTNPDLIELVQDLSALDFPNDDERLTFKAVLDMWHNTKKIDEISLYPLIPGGLSYLQRIQTGCYNISPGSFRDLVIKLRISRANRELYSFFEAQRDSVNRGIAPDFFTDSVQAELDRIASLKAELSPYSLSTTASKIEPCDIEWLWTNRIPLGMLTLFAGPTGAAKSLFSIALASRLSRATELPDDPMLRAPVSSLFIVSEDPVRQAVIPRFIANNGALDRIEILDFTSLSDQRDPTYLIKTVLLRHKDIRLIVIDPLNNVAAPKMKWGDDPSVRRYLLQPLIELSEKLNIAIVGIVHFKKQREGLDPLYCIAGSLAYSAAARSVIGFTVHPNDPTRQRRIASSIKMNYTLCPPPVAFSILPNQRLDIENSPITDIDPAEAFSLGYKEQILLNTSDSWLKDFLSPGPQPLELILKEASLHETSRATLFRSKARLRIQSTSHGFGTDKSTTWQLP